MLIEINAQQIERLIQCRKTNKKYQRCFGEWSLESLLNEAILEFNLKYKD